jgi:hypothetical protein
MEKWTDNELEKSINCINDGLGYDEIANLLNRTKKSVRLKLNKLGVFVKPKISTIEKECNHCNKVFVSLINDNRKYCSSSCAAKENNKLFIKRPKILINQINDNSDTKQTNCCLNCNCEIKPLGKQYCNSECFHKSQRKKYHNKIESGNIDLPSRQYRKYLIEKYGNKCMECGWSQKNPTTNKIPIELEHIDGNSSNNDLSNLKLLCPNCHSLTPTYKGANKGNGRYLRKLRYNEGKSY